MILRDGYRVLLTFLLGGMTVKILSVTPPGYDGRGPIDETSFENEFLLTKDPKALMDITNATMTVAYDPVMYSSGSMLLKMNANQLLTYTFPDGSQVKIYGYINGFKPGEHTEGNRPTASIEIVHTNHTGYPLYLETLPLYIAAP